MSEAFIHNIDALVTKDFLEKCLELQDEKMSGKFTLLFWMMGLGFSLLALPLLQIWLQT